MKRLVLSCLGVLCVLLVAGCDPEDRITFDVNTVADVEDPNLGDDVCGTPDTCSLRAALEEAVAGDKASITINVPGGTYLLEEGQLEVAGKLISVLGAGADSTVIDAQQDSRVMKISGGIVVVNDLTLRNGQTSSYNGGGLLIEGENTIVVLEDIVVRGSRSRFRGGGLYIDDASVDMKRSVVSDNRTGLGGGGGGGGIFNNGDLVIRDSTISGNKGGYAGGGIAHVGQRLNLTTSTVSNNLGPRSGLVLQGGSVLNNVTVSGNRDLDEGAYRDDDGVGISVFGRASFRNVTVTDNGNANSSRNDDSGGVFIKPAGNLTVRNSLIAGNLGGDCKGSVASNGHNLIGDARTRTCTVSSGTGDQLGSAAAPIDPRLGTLANNGGPTRTHALLVDSPAIDAGSNFVVGSDPTACLSTDQRGVERPQEGDGDSPTLCDIGAFELEP